MGFSTERIIRVCNDLVHAEFGLIACYNEAIRRVAEPGIADQLEALRLDNQQHVHDLTAIVRQFGGTPADPGGMGQTMRVAVARLSGLTGTEGLLWAMNRLADELAHRYEQADRLQIPGDVGATLARCLADERRHIDWMRDALRRRLWESMPAEP